MAKKGQTKDVEIKVLQFGAYPAFELSKLGSGPAALVDSAYSRNVAVEGQTQAVKDLLSIIETATGKGLKLTDESRITFTIKTAVVTYDDKGAEVKRENEREVSSHSVTIGHLRRESLSDLVWITKPERGRSASEKTDSMADLFGALVAPVEPEPGKVKPEPKK